MRLVKPFLRSGVFRRACILLASLNAACSSNDTDSVPNPGPSTWPTAADVDIKRYDLKGEYDWDRERFIATVDITLSPISDTGNVVELDSAVTEIKVVRLAGGKTLPFSINSREHTLRIDVATVSDFKKGVDITLEVDYEAAPSDSFIPVSGRRGDPLDVRAVFTDSEPLGVRAWMPCHDTPKDRAYFSIAMRMDDHEKMIANGDLISDEPDSGGSHWMKYETAYTLPTYVMAFAISDFEVKTIMKGNLPVSIWHRRGLQGHYDAVLNEMGGMIDRFEGLLGPYPFEKYAVVHLPSLPSSGMENASISFHFEGAGTEPLGAELQLTAHELAHQWFGDLMTIESWDDLWIKEGMASLLELEGVRDHSDKDGPFTLNGNDLYAIDGMSIRDVSLAPDDKYTAGPYGRAAWLLTQIRAVVGEDVFWKTLRKILDEHRFGVIGTEAFIDAFAEVLDPAIAARVKHAIDAKGLPTMTIEPLFMEGALVTINDPDGALIAPVEIGWVAENGSMRIETFEMGVPLPISPKTSGEFLVLDPKDHFLTWDSFLVDDLS
ncbi:MAG TPA: M1 family aminopeptidase, partial [Polyangium sp.]|nr:M1 family aminopeptidase [Polyangium sp.]